LAEGETNITIADQLYVSTNTVKNHKANLKKKLGLCTTYDLLRYAAQWAKEATNPTKIDENRGGGNQLIISELITIKVL
jgi:RecG-like helicase